MGDAGVKEVALAVKQNSHVSSDYVPPTEQVPTAPIAAQEHGPGSCLPDAQLCNSDSSHSSDDEKMLEDINAGNARRQAEAARKRLNRNFLRKRKG